MKDFGFMNSRCLYLEIGQSSLQVLNGSDGLELRLERLENGRLTGACKERLTLSLQGFLKRKSWHPRLRALCAIGARGVSLRQLTLPSSTKEELHRLLLLQIEREFPLLPDALAWGYRRLGDPELPRTGAGLKQELLVAAVKREVIEEYAEILNECGVNPLFTLSALARSCCCPKPPASYLVLDVGGNQSELICCENGTPTSIRIFPWGDEDVTRSIADTLKVSHERAEELRIAFEQESISDGEIGQAIQNATRTAVDLLAGAIKDNLAGQRLYLTGGNPRLGNLATRLARCLGGGMECEAIEIAPGQGRSAATLGLRKSYEQNGGSALLIIQSRNGDAAVRGLRPAPWKWAALAAALAVGSLSFPYAEAVLLKPLLARKLAEIRASKGKLLMIDREYRFLDYLKKNQSPYLDAVSIIANATSPGTRFDSLSMNRRGDVALRGSMRDGQQVADFRSKLIHSGLFSTVVIEEQTPTPDRQKVIVRISAQWKPGASRESLSIEPPVSDLDKSKAGGKEEKPAVSREKDASTPAAPNPSLPLKGTKE